METLFFIIIVLLLIMGLIYCQINNKENMMGNNYQQNIQLENTFRKDQISYYKKQDTKYNTKCDESKFLKLASGNTKLKEFGVCDFFSGKKVIENFNIDNVKPMESTQYAEEIEHCRLLNQSMKNLNVNNDAPLKDIISQLRQIPEFLQINSDGNTEDDKGCGYCFDENGVGEVLYGDSLGPFKNSGGKGVCKTWIKPGDIRRGGGSNLQNNKWKSEDDVETMKFGGNQGVIDDAIKIHEQQICSRVNNCGDLDGEKSICGWCYMGRKGDGKGEGMVAAVDENGNKIGETKYMDDYCPWPGEVDDSGKPTKKWTGPTEGSEWLKEESNKELSPADVQRIDLELQTELKNKFMAKKNDGSLESKVRLEADKAIKYVEDKIKYIMNFGNDTEGQRKYKELKDKLKTEKIGVEENNKFLYKCGGTETTATKDNIFFLHSFNGLSREQQIVLKGLHETHEFFKKCQTNMEILGEKITLKNNRQLITNCNKLTNIFNKPENKKLKDAFMAMDLSKDKAGCLENCTLTGGKYEFNSNLAFFKNWWQKKSDAKECTPLSLNEIKNIVGYDPSKAAIEDGEIPPTLENSTCCNELYQECTDSQEKCKRCPQDIIEASCRQYAIDIGLDPNDIDQYNPNAYVNQGYPYGCSTKLDGSQVIWVSANNLDEVDGRANKNLAVQADMNAAAADTAAAHAEGNAATHDYQAAASNNPEIDRLTRLINEEKAKENENNRKYQNAIKRKWKKRWFGWFWWWVPNGYRESRSNQNRYRRNRDTARRNKDEYQRQLSTENNVKNAHNADGNVHVNNQSSLSHQAAIKRRGTPDSRELDNKPFKNPQHDKDGRTQWYSVCSLKENKELVYPNLVAKAFRKDPTPGLRDNVKRWDKIINGEREIKSFQELIKVWLESKMQMQMDGQLTEVENNEYKETISIIWNIFIDLAKKKNPGLFNVDISLAKNNVLGNGSLNTSDKRRKLVRYEIDELKNIDLDPLVDDNGNFIERKGWRGTEITRNGTKMAGERLMITPGECTKLEGAFPCFKNYQGKKDISGNFPGDEGYNANKPMGHSEACYNELWNSQTQKNFKPGGGYGDSCFKISGKTFIEQTTKSFKKYDNKMEHTSLWLENSKYWQRSTIPSLKIDIEKIRKTADTSKQYEPIYTYDDENLTKEQITAQINNSAKVATLACYNEEPKFEDENGNTNVPYACEERFRNEDHNFPRPKKCMNYYWKKNTAEDKVKFANTSSTFSFKDPSSWNKNKSGDGNSFHILSDKYNPYPHLNNTTLGNVWGIANLPKAEFQDKLDFNFTNKQLDDKLKSDVDYIRKFQEKLTPTSKEYDMYLLKKRYIFEYINEGEDGIWENLKPGEGAQLKNSQNTDYRAENRMQLEADTAGRPWVKMCWGDFKETLRKEFKDTVKEDGDGTLNIGREPKLRKIIDGAEYELYRKIVKTKDKKRYNPKYGNFNSGGTIKFELDYPTSITERLYDKTWFPFWRFFAADVMSNGIKYYQRAAYNENEQEQHFQTTKRGKNFQKIEKTRPISGTVVMDPIPNNILKRGTYASGKPSLIHLKLEPPAYLHKITINGAEIGEQGWGGRTQYTLRVKKYGKDWENKKTSNIRRGGGRNTSSMRTLPHTIKYSFDYEEDYEFNGDGKISEIEVVGTGYRGIDLGSGHQVYYKGFQNASVEYFNTGGSDDKVKLLDMNPEYFKLFKDYSTPAFDVGLPSWRRCTGSVTLHQHGGFGGWRKGYKKGSYRSLGSKRNDMSSMKVPKGCKATLYPRTNFRGRGRTFGAGNYRLSALRRKGVRNDDVESIKVSDIG